MNFPNVTNLQHTLRGLSYAMACVGIGMAPVGRAAETAATEPATANYTDNPPVSTTTTISTYTPNYSNNYYDPTYGASAFRSPSFSTASSFTTWRQVIFFPPSEPALGENVPRKQNSSRGYNVPAKLETYISEVFFAPISVHLHSEELSKRRQQRIDAYRADKMEVLVDLRAALERTKDSDPSARTSALQELATRQNTRILELENTAEEIRDELTRGGWFSLSVDWNGYRNWRLGDDTRYESAVDEYKVTRGAIYFQRGLSVAQRRLLREITIELRDGAFSGNDPTAEIALDAPGPYVFFSPAASRIRLPLNLPASLLTRVDDFVAKKEVLKKELRETLYREDRAWFSSRRISALTQLAERQASAFVELDSLAEGLRRDLAGYAFPGQPTQSALSNDLVKRISTYLEARVDLQRDLVTRLQEIRTALPTDRVEFERKDGVYQITVVPNRSASSSIRKKRETILPTLPAFNEEKSTVYRTLERQRTALREEVRNVTLSTAQGNGKSIDELLSEFALSFEKQERWNQYREYRTAVLEPGLSPEQRRILYDATLEELMAFSPLSRL